MKYILIALMLASVPAGASQITQPISDCGAVLASLKSAGATGISSVFGSVSCVINWTEPQAGPVAIDPKYTAYTSLTTELAAIKSRLDAGTATVADIQRAVSILLTLLVQKN